RLAYLAHLLPADGYEVLQEDILIALLLHLLDICTGREGFVAAGEHQAADPGIGLEGIERLAELAHQSGAQCVERLRPVQANEADASPGLGLYVRVHGG